MESRRRECSVHRRQKIHEGHIRRLRGLEDQCEMVPVEPFRQRFLALQKQGEITLSQLCVHMGWVYRPNEARLRAERRRPGSLKANTSEARRRLGLIERRPGCPYKKQFVTYDLALRLAAVLGMDPHEAGV